MTTSQHDTLIAWIKRPTAFGEYILSKPFHCVPPPRDSEFLYVSSCVRNTTPRKVRTVKFALKHGSTTIEMEVTDDDATYATYDDVPRAYVSSPADVSRAMDMMFD